jgi:hypothetical protein
VQVLLAGSLGVTAALLVSCGSSGAGLIPVGNAGPLQGDFEAVAQAAQDGNGSCSATEAAIVKTEQDFDALPASVDAGLRNTLHQGIGNLRGRALVLCAQPLAQTATSTSPKVTTSTQTTTTPTTPTATTPTTPTTTTTTTPGPGGGTAAPGVGESPAGGNSPPGGGTGAGESGSGAGGAGESGAAGGGSSPGAAGSPGPGAAGGSGEAQESVK